MKILLVVGAESSGTRIFSKVLSEHPDIKGHDEVAKHQDLLDDLWTNLYNNELSSTQLKEFVPDCDKEFLLTRRSMPHGRGSEPAKFFDFPPIGLFCDLMKSLNHEVYFIITTRSPFANFVSCVNKRASSGNIIGNAKMQCHQAYLNIFSSMWDSIYWIVSLEGLAYDGVDYVNGIYRSLDLSVIDSIKELINLKNNYEL